MLYDVFTDEFYNAYIRPSAKYLLQSKGNMSLAAPKWLREGGLTAINKSFDGAVEWLKDNCIALRNLDFPRNAIDSKTKERFRDALL
jgi:hypothetical protein